MTGSVFSRTQRVALNDDIRVSFEFFPPKNEAMAATLADTIEKLAPLNADFVSVTYGAGGTTRQLTHEAVMALATQCCSDSRTMRACGSSQRPS